MKDNYCVLHKLARNYKVAAEKYKSFGISLLFYELVILIRICLVIVIMVKITIFFLFKKIDLTSNNFVLVSWV